MALQVGDTAPDFVLEEGGGQEYQLSQFQGRWVILYFYPKDNTPGCTKEACGFRDHYAALQAENAEVIGVSMNNAQSHQKFATKYDLPFPLLCDLDASVAKQYESYGPKKFMGKEYEGIYRRTFIINPAGKLAKIYPKVRPEPHPHEVYEDLQRLKSTEPS
ncbi:thioredoxin-dependent thiol peroxidase [Lyngbya confervoides]|uniref:thioredoxin-dependent peroxiredoxin n=1 Tax=Lyngbya confervoides BDU141951 TaxID=1574623 RepID=A0ABD4T5Q4_9CYAN|nr:thioredoxin-dependent thiol peroxidase [Lyngbya confervoides]MCM1984111.1 thioredoxin-dependent thiol peroxidase [Lyngbya confervoides BDU141951]